MGKNDRKGNVLVIGNSGVGKSTLINAVVGEQVAVTGRGTAGQTNRLEIYGEDDASPFRIMIPLDLNRLSSNVTKPLQQ